MVAKPSLMSHFMNPGRANQISSIRSENLLGDQRPEAACDKWSPASGARLCLMKTLKDLSLSAPLCWDDMLSFEASRWPFVYNDPLIFFSPPAWFLILSLTAVVLPSSPGEMMEGRTAAASKEVKKKGTEKESWMGRRSPILTSCWIVDASSLKRNILKNLCFSLFTGSPLWYIDVGYPSTWPRRIKHGLCKKHCTGTGHKRRIQTLTSGRRNYFLNKQLKRTSVERQYLIQRDLCTIIHSAPS